MAIEELPFFAILLLTLLPITIGIIITIRLIDVLSTMYRSVKTKKRFTSITDIGEMLLLLIFVVVIIELVTYIIGEQPSGFSVFTFLIEDMLPLTWYTILLYGTLINVGSLIVREGGKI